ncbi:MAG: response regulator transcription factor [Streptococcaceae bacterium]|jgi:two-component system KDP operon response regulator KdpE|nr:response regulator transcription factor [Streptococcaceae bacterium]
MENEKYRILICEDDPSVNKLLSLTMELEGYAYSAVQTGKSALRELVAGRADLLILDLGLPDMDGSEIIRKVRSFSQLPIIVVSARGESQDKIQALDEGADDYLTKPFSTDELLARLRVSLRRASYTSGNSPSTQATEQFVNGNLRIAFPSNQVFVGQQEIHLTPIEYKLLCLLSENLDRVLTYNFIVKKIWGYHSDDFSDLRVFANTLRKKIGQDEGTSKMIQTHIGVGYRMIKVD